jgi:hypothetical protein
MALESLSQGVRIKEERPFVPDPVARVNLPTTILPSNASEHTLDSTSTKVGAHVKEVDSKAESTVESAVEKEDYLWSGYLEDEHPEKVHGFLHRNLRYQAFSIYRRLFSVVFLTNLAVFIWTMVKQQYDANTIGGILIANVFLGVLMRQEIVVNIIFTVATSIPSS